MVFLLERIISAKAGLLYQYTEVTSVMKTHAPSFGAVKSAFLFPLVHHIAWQRAKVYRCTKGAKKIGTIRLVSLFQIKLNHTHG